MALLVDPREREEMETSSAPRDVAVVGRDEAADSGREAAALADIKRSCSLPSRIGQLRERAPMTSICLRSEP